MKHRFRKEQNRLTGSSQKALDLEVQLHKHLSQLSLLKQQQEEAHEIHQEHLRAMDEKYRSVLAVCQRQEMHIIDLYRVQEELTSAMLMKDGAGTRSSKRGMHKLRNDGSELFASNIKSPAE